MDLKMANGKRMRMVAAIGTLALLAACGDNSSSDPLTGPEATDTTVEALAECTAPAFLKEGDKKTSLSKALLKMLAGKIFKIEE